MRPGTARVCLRRIGMVLLAACAADTTCTNLKSADCLGCGVSVMACFPNTPLH